MLMAFIMWILGLAGVAPTEEDFARMHRQYEERGHHLIVDFGSERVGGTRWSDPDWAKRPTVGLGYEYLVDHRFHGVGFEALAQWQGNVFTDGGPEDRVFVGGGLNYYPVRKLRIFTQGGAMIDTDGDVRAVGRVGLGIRFMFFHLAMQPYAYVQTDTNGQLGWSLQFRFQY